MSDIRLGWEPENKASLLEMKKCVTNYMQGRKNGVTIFSNGTLLFTPCGRDDLDDAKKAMKEAKYLIDFTVTPMKDGAYLVQFNHVVAVFVGADEFRAMRSVIIRRYEELKFPEEVLFQENQDEPRDHILIGLYARGKLQYDVHNFSIYNRIEGV